MVLMEAGNGKINGKETSITTPEKLSGNFFGVGKRLKTGGNDEATKNASKENK